MVVLVLSQFCLYTYLPSFVSFLMAETYWAFVIREAPSRGIMTLIHRTVLGGGYYYFPHSTDEETNQRSEKLRCFPNITQLIGVQPSVKSRVIDKANAGRHGSYTLLLVSMESTGTHSLSQYVGLVLISPRICFLGASGTCY